MGSLHTPTKSGSLTAPFPGGTEAPYFPHITQLASARAVIRAPAVTLWDSFPTTTLCYALHAIWPLGRDGAEVGYSLDVG